MVNNFSYGFTIYEEKNKVNQVAHEQTRGYLTLKWIKLEHIILFNIELELDWCLNKLNEQT